ncbi:hypothetical protein GIB67_042936 [Kingdonia uniflora]|uniref:Metallophosphoesterase n=1 Tax=Kingdonia uniflora TaxID=39325 RepID=A0A7J7L5W2_9MAGN|nr:hypothetical protein GIB67_042936 [Kingdonia uniflora]
MKSLSLLLLLLLPLLTCFSQRETNIIQSEGGVVWVVQLSDLHFSVHHPDRALDFKNLIGPTLAIIKPSLVFITGDLTGFVGLTGDFALSAIFEGSGTPVASRKPGPCFCQAHCFGLTLEELSVLGSSTSCLLAVRLCGCLPMYSIASQSRSKPLRLIGHPSLWTLGDGKSKDMLTMKQDEEEWKEYQNVMENVVQRSGLDKKIFYDLRGNHDNFGVPTIGGSFDFFSKYSINGGLRRRENVQGITLESGGRMHLFVGFDSTMSVGLRGPTNLFGHPTDQLLVDIDYELSQWDSQSIKPVTKISFGHFPLSFSSATHSGKTVKDVFLKHSLSAYLCGHLHTRFGKNLKRSHQSVRKKFFSLKKYFQFNIHQTSPENNKERKNCFNGAPPMEEFWEWEMGDWRRSRAVRVLAIDKGHVSFLDFDFKAKPGKTVILPTFPIDSRYMPTSNCQTVDTSTYDTVRTLVFSSSVIASIVARVYDSRSGNHDLVMEGTMRKLENNSTRGDIYIVPWNWRAFVDPSPDRFWLQIEAFDIMGRSTLSELRPFSINGVILKLSWTWKEFLVMGCQWDRLYYPIMGSVFMVCLILLLSPNANLLRSNQFYSYKDFTMEKGFLTFLLWILTELSRISFVWFGLLLYLYYLISFPWFFGQVFTEGGSKEYMTYMGWAVNISNERGVRKTYIGYPDVMVIVLPHLCFVVLPAILVIGGLAAERAAYREHYLSLSGKKEDDYSRGSERNIIHGRRWIRKLLMVVCLTICWKHWKSCRALVKAYEMNPFLHSAGYCFPIPVLLAYTVYKTMRA